MSDIEQRIAQMAPAPSGPIDTARVWHRARRRRQRRLLAITASAASLVLLAGAGLVAAQPGTPHPVVDQPSNETRTDVPTDPAPEDPDAGDPAPAPIQEQQGTDARDAASGHQQQVMEALFGRTFVAVELRDDQRSYDLADGSPIVVAFSADGEAVRIDFTGGCNDHHAAIEAADRRLHLHEITRTDHDCPAELAEQDAWTRDFLEAHPAWQLDGERLLLTAGQVTLELRDDTDADSSEEQRPPARVVASEATVPGGEPAMEFADIATDPAGAVAVWERFGLSGEPPALDFDSSALLAVGFGESGSCAAEFRRIDRDEGRLRLAFGIEGVADGEQVGCTDDYNPRTFVLEVDRTHLPAHGFVLELARPLAPHPRLFVLSAAALDESPAGPSVLDMATRERPQLDVVAEPSTAGAGRQIEIVLNNVGDVAVSYHEGSGFGLGARGAALRRWEAQRWLPARGQDEYDSHASLRPHDAEIGPGERAVLLTVDSTDLGPGWYRVDAIVSVGGSGGTAHVAGVFHLPPT
jgi:hypothetical protein